jgi:peptidyl-prolyl cis-trans isomerase-like protein 2
MANKGVGTNGSQWYITFQPAPHLDGKHTVFGKLVGGENILDALENIPRKDGTERPSKEVKIVEIVMSVACRTILLFESSCIIDIRIHLRTIKPA